MIHKIMFRAKHIDLKEWQYFMDIGHLMVWDISDYHYTFENWGQYVGIIDKNETCIFTDDIVLADGIKGIVIYNTDDLMYMFKPIDISLPIRALWVFKDDIEVIGNVYDNPELLKGDE